jgi:ribonuclease Z
MPRFSIIKDEIPPLLDVGDIVKTTSQDIIDSAKAAHDSIERDQEALQAWRQLLARPDTEVITLGTGSALPSKYRNVSATLVRVPGIGNYLLDCGENTLGQLQRVFTPEELTEVFRGLRMIWISHLHADHHLGTTAVIKAWYRIVHGGVPAASPPSMPSIADSVSERGLCVVSHSGMLNWLYEYSSVEDFGYSRILPLRITPHGSNKSELYLWPPHGPDGNNGDQQLRRQDYQAVLGLSDIQACKVSHCQGSMAVSLTFPPDAESQARGLPPLKVSYSGDCRPSNAFAKMGKNTTVLVHEATFDDELAADARAKKHSTTSEALGIAARMGAKAVVLTHFSQRYQKIPVIQTVDNDVEEEETTEATRTEDVEMDEGEDGEENVDMTVANTGNANPALPTDAAATARPNTSAETVVKVKAKDLKVAIAFDYMRVRIGDIAKMEKFNPALEKLLSSAEGETDGGVEQERINGNGKKTSPSTQGGSKKKSKRNN